MLADDVSQYCEFAGIEPITAQGYRRSVRCLSRFLGRQARRDDLNAATVNRWLAHVAQSRSARTVLNRKRGLTPVWNWLADRGLVPHYNPRELRRVRVAFAPVTPWSIADVRALLRASADLAGRLRCGLAASDLMAAWVLVAYETGLRPSDLRRLSWSSFTDPQTISIVQNKTKRPIVKRITPRAASAVAKLRSTSDHVFPLSKSGLRRWEQRLFAAAVRYGFYRRKGQGSGTLRKTHGTEVCRARDAQAAALSLGHVSGPAIALQSYIATEAVGASEPPQELIDGLSRRRSSRTDKAAGRCNRRSG